MEYKPERWLGDDGPFQPVSPFRWYTVFHAGPRMCLGKDMGRLAAIWGADCMKYRPERWLGDDGAFRYTVFHAGRRMCLGKEMAYVQMKSIVASVLEE
ncbi:hypothetical protein EJB05_29655 [Eragrostis curvula]|uniref:Cytochrome P450 n=1 Tax=Eragrostis curvula TaxID=38414 RepID=A0A5J9UTW7_9POAL|nr:hypothetical protein EJB05_29655 [Eragrostis curvula]